MSVHPLPHPTDGAEPHLDDEDAEVLAVEREEGIVASKRRVRHITGIEPSRTFDHDKIAGCAIERLKQARAVD